MESEIYRQYKNKTMGFFMKMIILELVLLGFIFTILWMESGGDILQPQNDNRGVFLMLFFVFVGMLLVATLGNLMKIKRVRGFFDSMAAGEITQLDAAFEKGIALGNITLAGDTVVSLGIHDFFIIPVKEIVNIHLMRQRHTVFFFIPVVSLNFIVIKDTTGKQWSAGIRKKHLKAMEDFVQEIVLKNPDITVGYHQGQ